MRLVSIDSLSINEKVGIAIRNEDGSILLPANAVVTERYIDRLKNFGIKMVYVEDSFFEDVIIKPALSPETKAAALGAVNNMLAAIASNKEIKEADLSKCVMRMLEDIGSRVTEPISMINMFGVKEARSHHAVNVATLVGAMAKYYTYDQSINSKVVEEYVLAALYHDAYLTSMDADQSDKSHPEKVYTYLKSRRTFSAKMYMTCYMHHENFDGSGFPLKKKGEDIYIGARLLAIADLYDNLVNGYGGYKKMKEHEAYEYINAKAHTMVDSSILSCFNKSIAVYPVGSTVLLNNGYNAIVIEQTVMPTRPKVRLSMPKKEECLLFNLVNERTMFIDKVLT